MEGRGKNPSQSHAPLCSLATPLGVVTAGSWKQLPIANLPFGDLRANVAPASGHGVDLSLEPIHVRMLADGGRNGAARFHHHRPHRSHFLAELIDDT